MTRPASAVRGALLVAAAFCASKLLLCPLRSGDWLSRPLGDDAFYYLTVARNIGEGQGITYDGAPTNGFHPLQMAVCVVLGLITGFDQQLAPMALVFFNLAVFHLLGTWLLVRLVSRLVPVSVPLVVSLAVLWNASGAGLLSYTGLETPLALCGWLWVLTALHDYHAGPSLRAAGWLGVAGGVAFLARNDIAVLCGLAVLSMVFPRMLGASSAETSLRDRVRFASIAGVVMVILTSPWLLRNLVLFGSPMPQSGAAEAVGSLYDAGRMAQWRAVAVSAVVNLAVANLPVDSPAWLGHIVILLGVPLALAGLVLLWRIEHRASTVLRCAVAASLVLVLVYGSAFGAAHMVRRWLAPLVVGGILGATALAASKRPRALHAFAAFTVLLYVAKLGVEVRRISSGGGSFRTNTVDLAAFVARQPAGTRIGALQSGLPGWVRPGVVNLDGKMDRRVLAAIRGGNFATWLAASDLDIAVDYGFFGRDLDPAVLARFERCAGPADLIVLRRRSEGVVALEPCSDVNPR
ncbi:hypothetical protein [Polyangium mundeleinium]|uniref:Glycosyltransferase RgtA/B/C/D-like domain-containing protein n=1 Tax=Polyangium mundeleinium TaxID=2995306 RepID=A0ABT5F5K4_9BACT|nr:hypothetical protein [Polyangium mundeleinium]MDC0748422.1 hypothetical protein [Polyangium mundeleinium]